MVWTSLFGIITIVLLARAMGFARAPQLDEAHACRIAADALPGFHPADAALAAGQRAALVGSGDGRVALVRGFGDRWVVRLANGAAARVESGHLHLKLAETGFPPADLDLGSAAGTWAQRL